MANSSKKFIIIDGNALLHRAWHALPPLTTRDGKLVNAVYGFASIMLTIIKELKPDYGVVAFDPPGGTFRHEVYKEYKATRQKQPDELYEQIPLIKDVAKDFGFSIEERKGYEADDVIGTLARQAAKKKLKTVIVTGDMDALQLIDQHTVVFTLRKGIKDTITYDIAGVKEKYGFGPEQVVEYKALAGDLSDNIPGVAGVGDKTAKELLSSFGTIDEIYAYIEKGGGKKIKETVAKKLVKDKERAFLSHKLATIATDIKIPFSLKELEIQPAQQDDLLELFRKLEFRSLVSRAQETFGTYKPRSEKGQASLFTASPAVADKNFEIRKGYTLINTKKQAEELAQRISSQRAIALDTETDSLGALTSNMLGISIAAKTGEAYYITALCVHPLREALASSAIRKYGHNIKYDIEVLRRAGYEVGGVAFDSMIASYVLHPTGRSHSLDNLAFVELRHQMVPIESLIGKRGKKQLSLADVALERVADYAAEDADYTLQLCEQYQKQITKEGFGQLMRDIEVPLISVLASMEEAGVKIDTDFLAGMSKKMGKRVSALEKKICQLADARFNVNSPIQLKEVLFGKLQLSTEGIGKTKTGFSTAAGELEKIADAHPIIPLIMEHRELAKLKNTYLDALPALVNSETGRVHTHFNQAVASTGRLSSSDPNLQNIPIRTELGAQIRRAFIPERGCVLVSADYSQIELRVAADMSQDKKLAAIFNKGLDVHTSTAAFIHGIDEAAVTPEIRRTAKEVNFGVLYGMGAHGLSQRTGLSHQEAKEFIERYFGAFAGVKAYIDQNLELARELGYVETRYGRRLPLPDINSGMQQIRAAAERLATNMPIQGTAADIIKMAMIEIHRELPRVSSGTKMLMQVHDELVFEVPKKDEQRVMQYVKEAMESVASLSVPVAVEIHSGNNWQEAH